MVFKISVFVKKNPEWTYEEFYDYWSNKHAKLFLDVPAAKKYYLRYGQFHINAKLSSELASSLPGLQAIDCDGVSEFWADSLEDVMAFMQDEEYQRSVGPDEHKFTRRDELKILVGEYKDMYISDRVVPPK